MTSQQHKIKLTKEVASCKDIVARWKESIEEKKALAKAYAKADKAKSQSLLTEVEEIITATEHLEADIAVKEAVIAELGSSKPAPKNG